ncbi:MAG: undecaprenyl-diphosphatase UppP [Candidatus Goldbacteria bacterium]|nr:undecaprenyl-diphosphatase UppP [Candidatus Goldiibacteriota bacterium]
MELINSIILGIIQGLTEFLPVSSSAHLALVPKFMNASELLSSLSFGAFLHGGTLLGVLIFYRKKIWAMMKSFFKGLGDSGERNSINFKLSIYIIIATIPAVVFALAFNDAIEGIFRSPVRIALMLAVFGVILYLADLTGKKNKENGSLTIWHAIIIGCAQAIALMPGVSRSGITMTAALFMGYKKEDAAEFSFLLSIPAIAGAFVHELPDIIQAGPDAGVAVIAAGFIASTIAGLFAIKFLLAFIKKRGFMAFMIYRLAIAAVIIILLNGIN